MNFAFISTLNRSERPARMGFIRHVGDQIGDGLIMIARVPDSPMTSCPDQLLSGNQKRFWRDPVINSSVLPDIIWVCFASKYANCSVEHERTEKPQ
jgi:hypothetical protein